jgi:hypothetical protein
MSACFADRAAIPFSDTFVHGLSDSAVPTTGSNATAVTAIANAATGLDLPTRISLKVQENPRECFVVC